MPSTLAILAGGFGTRMGMPKSHLTLAGQPILEHLLDRLAWPGPTLLVTAPGVERPPGHERFTAEVIDAVPGQGPLRGLLTAAEATAGGVLFTTVDMPNVNRAHLEWLERQLEAAEPHVVAIACRRSGELVEPFPCALRAGATQSLRESLSAGRLSARSFFERADSRLVQTPADWPGSVWLNLNRPEDLDRLGE